MINISNALKTKFEDGQSHDVGIRLDFMTTMYGTTPLRTITGDQIKAESVTLTESICDSDFLDYGQINTAMLTCQILNVDENLSGLYMKATLIVDGSEIPYGRYVITSYERQMYEPITDITAYDYTYLLNRDIKSAYYKNGIGRGGTPAQDVKEVFNALGLQYGSSIDNLDNSYSSLNRTMSRDTVYAADIVRWAAEVSCGWIKANRDGKMVFRSITSTSATDGYKIKGNVYPQCSKYEKFTCKAYDGVSFDNYFVDAEQATIPAKYSYTYIPTGSSGLNIYPLSELNQYMILQNYSQMDASGQKILNKQNSKYVEYVPLYTKVDGLPFLEPGDRIIVTLDDIDQTEISTIITNITHTGIGGMMTTIEAKGSSSTGESSYSQRKSSSSVAGAVSALTSTLNNPDYIATQVIAADEAVIGSLSAKTVTAERISTAIIDAEEGTINQLSAKIIDADKADIKKLAAEKINADYIATEVIKADTAKFNNLSSEIVKADKANIEKITTNKITADYMATEIIKAETTNFGYMAAEVIKAEKARIEDITTDKIDANYIATKVIKADKAKFDAMSSDIITAGEATILDITANNITAEFIKSDIIESNEMSSHYASIDLENVNNSWIENGVIKDAAITNAQILEVSANKLTLGELDCSKVKVSNLNAKSITTGSLTIGGLTINVDESKTIIDGGTAIKDGSITLAGLAADVINKIDGAIETWSGTVAPTLVTYPTSEWDESEYASHVGDVYYLINEASEQNGRSYRFANNRTSTGADNYEWILISDSDVTRALQELADIKGNVDDLLTFESNTDTWIENTDEELSSLKSRTESLETGMGDKVSSTTFSEVKQTVEANTSSITTLTTTVDNLSIGSANYIMDSEFIGLNDYNAVVGGAPSTVAILDQAVLDTSTLG